MSAVEKIKNQRSEPQNSPTEVRTAYSYFHEKRTKNAAGKLFVYGPNHPKAGQPNPRWSSTFLLPKRGDAATCPNYLWLWSLAQEAARKMWPQNVDAAGNWVWPAGAQLAIKDGDVPIVPKPKPGVPQPSAEEIAKRNEWRRGYWVIEPENFLDTPPRIAKVINGQAVDLPARVGADGVEQYKWGDWGFVNLHAYAYQNETFGVNFGFDGFLFTREGERIGNASGPKSTAQMFGNIAPAATPGQVAPPAPAVQAYAPPVQPAMPSPPVAPAAQYAAPAMAAPMPPQPPVAPAAPAPGGVGLPPLPPGMPGR